MELETINDLVKQVDEEEICVVKLYDLRNIAGYSRLGSRVLAELSQLLRDHGLGYFPARTIDDNESPRFSDEVRVYKQNSNIGTIVSAVQYPTETKDEYLLEIGASKESVAAETLEKIRALVGD